MCAILHVLLWLSCWVICNATCVRKYFVVGQHLEGQKSVSWEGTRTVDEWLCGQPHQSWKQDFEEHGVLVSFMLFIHIAEVLSHQSQLIGWLDGWLIGLLLYYFLHRIAKKLQNIWGWNLASKCNSVGRWCLCNGRRLIQQHGRHGGWQMHALSSAEDLMTTCRIAYYINMWKCCYWF